MLLLRKPNAIFSRKYANSLCRWLLKHTGINKVFHSQMQLIRRTCFDLSVESQASVNPQVEAMMVSVSQAKVVVFHDANSLANLNYKEHKDCDKLSYINMYRYTIQSCIHGNLQ